MQLDDLPGALPLQRVPVGVEAVGGRLVRGGEEENQEAGVV